MFIAHHFVSGEKRQARVAYMNLGQDEGSAWGHHAWRFIHYASFQYPERPSPAQQAGAKRWLKDLVHVLPCPRCSSHWKEYVEEHEPAVSGRDAMARYVWEAHNAVNRRLKKPEMSWSKAVAEYSPDASHARKVTGAAKHIAIVVGSATLLIASVVFLERKCRCG